MNTASHCGMYPARPAYLTVPKKRLKKANSIYGTWKLARQPKFSQIATIKVPYSHLNRIEALSLQPADGQQNVIASITSQQPPACGPQGADLFPRFIASSM